MMELTDSEVDIIIFLREAKPYESINIQKDATGRPDYYIITREQKVFFPKLSTGTQK